MKRHPLFFLFVSSVASAAPPPAAPAVAATQHTREAPAATQQTPSSYAGHGAASVAPEILAKYAPTTVPAETSRKIQAMLDVRAPGGARVTPDGKRMFFNWSVTGTSQVWRIDGPDHFPVQMTGGEDATRIVGVAPDGKRVVLSRDRRGEENPGLYLQDSDGGALVEVFHQAGVRASYGFASDDGKSLWFTANDVKPDAYAVHRYDLATGKGERVFEEPGLWEIADHRSDGKLLLAKATGSLTSEWYELDPATKKLTPLVGAGEKEEYDCAYGERGELLVRTNKLGDFRRLYTLGSDGKLAPITGDAKADVSAFGIDLARRHIAYELDTGGHSELHALDAATYKEVKLPKFDRADQVVAGSMTRDGRFVVIGVETAKAPAQSYVYEWKTGRLVRWVLPSAPEIDTRTFAGVTVENYPARDGTKIPVLVRRPTKCDGPCPVVVAFHGGPEGQSRPGFSTIAQLFVDAGFVYVEPNVRGSEGYGKAWLHSDDGAKRLAVITDIEDASVWAKKTFAQGGKAPKVGIFGGSYGGYSSLIGMTMFAGAYDAGVEIVGISNLITFLMNTAPYRRILRTSEYGDPEKDHDALVKLSPITYVDRIKAPLLLIQGASDPRVPVGEAVQIQQVLEAKKIASRLVIFPDEGHGAQKRDNRVIQFGLAIEFFTKYLKQ